MGNIITRAGKGQALTAADHDANMNELYNHPDGMFLPKGKSIQVKDLGTQAMSYGWRDMIGSVRDDLALVLPTPTTYIGGIRQPMFAVGNEEVREFHIPHDYQTGTDLYIHAHWSHNSTSVSTGGVTWQFECMSAKGHGTDSFYTPVIINVTQAAHLTRYQHMVAEGKLSEPDGGVSALLDTNWIDVDGIIVVSCRLLTNTMDGGANPFLHSFDIHYQSTNLATKNKAPDFNA